MSGIYGIFRFDGAPVTPESLQMMRQAMAYYGPDGGGEWSMGPIGLGQLRLCVTPEDLFEAQPLTADGITLVAAARLDNRDELLKEFQLAVDDCPTTPDGRLVLEAYRRWGEECPEHLNGDWQFAAWDSRSRKLFIARDHHGISDLCYYQHPRFLAFASGVKGLLALAEVDRRVDLLKMAQELTGWSDSPARTAYEDIFRLPPAHTLRVGETGVATQRYWFPENLPTLYLPRDEDYVEQFLDIYRQAVRVRLRSTRSVGIALSGGLDSGSVAALAAPILAERGSELTAFTSVPRFAPSEAGEDRTGDEWLLASATARQAGNIAHLPLRCDDTSVLAGIERNLEIFNEPVSAPGNAYWINALFKKAQERGIGALLTGQDGNATVSFTGSGDFLAPLFRGEFRFALRSFCHAEPNLWLTLKRHVAKPLLMPVIQRYNRYLRGGETPWREYSAIHPNFARDMRLTERMRETGHDPAFTTPLGRALQLAILEPGSNPGGALWYQQGMAYGMDVRDPTVDRRLVEFCLRIPDHQYRWRGECSWLLRRTMTGRMPQEVLYNGKRGLQSADLGHRLLHEHARIAAVLDQLEQSGTARECLDIDAMRAVLAALERKVTSANTRQSRAILLDGLNVGLFLSRC